MKSILSIATLLTFFSFTSGAQQILLSEDFDSYTGYSITNWLHTYTGPVPWQSGLPYLVTGNCNNTPGNTKVGGVADCGWNYNKSNVFMYSHAIDLTNITDAWLRYDSYFRKLTSGSFVEKATVEVSIDGGNSWTIIQDLPAVAVSGHNETYYLDLTAYTGHADVRIGFRYSDGGGAMMGWAIDNISVFKPSHKDLAIIAVDPKDPLLSYVATGQTITPACTVYNAGLDTIHSFDVNYSEGAGPVASMNISGVTIPPFTTYNVVHSTAYTMNTMGDHTVKMWVDLAGDVSHANDTMPIVFRGAAFIPKKRLVIEEGTGTWHGLCPRGWVYMNQINDDNDICLISVHNEDPMMVPVYDDFMFYLRYNYVPFFQFDRKMNVEADSFFTEFIKQKNNFGFADIALNPYMHDGDLIVETTVKPAIDISGDVRLALVLTEDGVTGTDTGYGQKNNYAGNALGPMGGFENKPNPVPAQNMTYNFVARSISPQPDGDPASLPLYMTAGHTYTAYLSAPVNPAWNRKKMKAIVLMLRNSDSAILNGNKAAVPNGISETAKNEITASLYPNPAGDGAWLYWETGGHESMTIIITDIMGRIIYSKICDKNIVHNGKLYIETDQLSNGIYITNLNTISGHKTLKLEVLH